MGKQSRLRAERRQLARLEVPISDEARRILRAVLRDIERSTFEPPRQCWDYLLELMAHASGWKTDTNESEFLWDKIPNLEVRLADYCRVWNEEVAEAKKQGSPFSEPLGDLLMETGAGNAELDQYQTPMHLVRATNANSIEPTPDEFDPEAMDPGLMLTGMDPWCGTGRFIIDALVHHDHLMMRGVEIDLSLLRAAMINLRYLAQFTSMVVDRARNSGRPPSPFDANARETLRQQGVAQSQPEGTLQVVGGRGLFMHADSTIVDLQDDANWMIGAWSWKPQRWQANLFIDPRFGFVGSWDEYKTLHAQPKGVADFSMESHSRKGGVP